MSDESVCSVCSRLTGFGDEDKGEPPVNLARCPSPETGDVGWCWWAYGSMGCAPTYEDACRAAEAAIYRGIANRMAVM